MSMRAQVLVFLEDANINSNENWALRKWWAPTTFLEIQQVTMLLCQTSGRPAAFELPWGGTGERRYECTKVSPGVTIKWAKLKPSFLAGRNRLSRRIRSQEDLQMKVTKILWITWIYDLARRNSCSAYTTWATRNTWQTEALLKTDM